MRTKRKYKRHIPRGNGALSAAKVFYEFSLAMSNINRNCRINNERMKQIKPKAPYKKKGRR